MALKPIEQAEFIEEIERLVLGKGGDSAGGLITSVDWLQEQLEKLGFKFSPEEFCVAINRFLYTRRAKLGKLCVSEYKPNTLSVDIEFIPHSK